MRRIGDMAVGDVRNRLGSRESRPFALGVIRRLSPGVQPLQPLFALAQGAGILPGPVDAICAAVHLRRPQLDQVQQATLEAQLFQVSFQAAHRPVGLGGDGEVESWLYAGCSFCVALPDDVTDQLPDT